MPEEEKELTITVVFKGARDPANRTETIKLRGRPDIPIDGQGEVTVAELDVLVNQTGLILEIVEDDEKAEADDAPKTTTWRSKPADPAPDDSTAAAV